MDPAACASRLAADRASGEHPLMVVGTAGTVGTGAVDPIRELAAICREQRIWFHVDGAYGAPAAVLPDAPPELHALALADSLSVDPHKWLYAPLEAGCVLVRDPARLRRGVRLVAELLPVRDGGGRAADQLSRAGAAELARLSGAQGLAGAPSCGTRRLRAHDRRGLPDGGGAIPGGGRAP